MNLKKRSAGNDTPGDYTGGVAYRGSHGLAATEPGYPSCKAFKYCGNFIILDEGRMVDVVKGDIFNEEMIEQVYGARTKILKDGKDLFILTLDYLDH